MARKPRIILLTLLLIMTVVSIYSIAGPSTVPNVTAAALTVTLNPTSGKLGDVILVTATGASVPSGTACSITDNAPVSTPLVTQAVASVSGGSVSGSFTVGSSPAPAGGGTYTVTVRCPSSGTDSGSASFTVNPSVKLTPSVGVQNQVIKLSGVGFRSDMSSCAITVAAPVTSPQCLLGGSSGTVTGQFTVDPAAVVNSYTITVTQTAPAPAPPSATGSFQVVAGPTITINPTGAAGQRVPAGFGTSGSGILVQGSGFSTGVSRVCTLSTNPVTSIIISPACNIASDGSMSGTFGVSSSAAPASYVIRVTDTNPAGVFAQFTSLVVAAQPVITVPASSTAGQTVTISSGAVFSERDQGSCILVAVPSTLFASTTCFIDSTGMLTVSTNFVVSTTASGQTYQVKVQPLNGDNSAIGTFTVKSAITLSVTSGSPPITGSPSAPATEVTVSGTGFFASQSCTITSSMSTLVIDTSGEPACSSNANGVVSGKFRVGALSTFAGSPGTVTVKVTGNSAGDFPASPPVFTVIPQLALTPTSGAGGTFVNVAGAGFSATDAACSPAGLLVFAPSDPSSSSSCAVSGTSGQVTGSFSVKVPTPAAGVYVVSAVTASDSASASFTVGTPSAQINLTPSTAVPGTFVTITGSGFNPSDTSCVVTGPASLFTPGPPCAISSGSVQASFVVLSGAPAGISLVTVTGQLTGPTPNDFASAFFSVPITITTTTTSTSSSTLTVTSSTSTIVSSTSFSTSLSTTTVSSIGISTAIYTIYTTTSILGQTTTSITNAPVYTVVTNSTSTVATSTMTAVTTVTTTVTGFIIRALSDSLNDLGLLAVAVLLVPGLFRRYFT